MKVLVIGDLSVSVAAETPRLPRPGENLILRNPTLIASGVAANISADLRGLGVDTYVSGVVGRDVFGSVVVHELTSWGVHTRYIGRSLRPTSIFMVIVDGDGERTMIGYRGASETLRLDRQLIEEIKPDWVHVSGYTLLNRGQEKELGPFIKAATSKGVASLDLEGVAYSARSLPLEGAYVFCNQDEYNSYFRTKEVAPLSYPFTTLLKAGPSGSYLIRRGGLRRSASLALSYVHGGRWIRVAAVQGLQDGSQGYQRGRRRLQRGFHLREAERFQRGGGVRMGQRKRLPEGL